MLRKVTIGLGELEQFLNTGGVTAAVAYHSIGRGSRTTMAKNFKNLDKLAKPYTMFAKENSLPQLPVPPLQQTLEKYLVSLLPLLTKEEFLRAEHSVKELGKPNGIGEILQTKLLERAKNTDNWLAEWWDDCAYLKFTAPVVINSSPGIIFPKLEFETQKDQLRYAARLIRNVLSFKSMVDSRSLPVDMQGKDPLTMVQYKKILSTCRIPNKGGDYQIVTPKEESRHIIVMHNHHFFALDVYIPGAIKRLSEEELIYQLERIIQASPEPDPNPIGVLTSTDRVIWASNWKKLRKDRINRFGLDTIVKSIFLLNLDQPCPPPTNTPSSCEDGVLSVSCSQSLHGGGVESNSCNRYFDKILQFFISRDGHNGVCYEHSSAEGPPVQLLSNYILQNRNTSVKEDLAIHAALEQPKKLEWTINPAMQDKIESAMDSMDSMVEDVEMRMIRYTNYGKNVPKKHKMSPDAFLQMAFQLAYFRLHGHNPPTYESASLRKFKRGRTETIRSASVAAQAFCVAMDSEDVTAAEKRDLFRKAVEGHSKYTREAGNGQGVDRHLLGLRLTAMENKIPLPELFRDKGFLYSTHFKLSTSQVPAPFDTVLCFGPVVPDGYGLCYNPLESQFNLAISAFNSNPITNAGLFGQSIIKSLDDLELLLTTASL